MKALISTMALLLMIPTLARAQGDAALPRGQGYVFIGQGADSSYSPTLGVDHEGGGAEVRLVQGLEVGGEIGRMAYNRTGGGSWGMFSLDPSYHFFPRSSKAKVVPFVEAGYTRLFDKYYASDANLFNFGAGLHYWFTREVGMRLEFRDHYLPGPLGHTGHYWGLRIGLAFR
jgi:hypothetical protein